MLSGVRKTLKRYGMLRTGDRVVLGVSGGADSVGLLHALSELTEYKLDIIIAHLNLDTVDTDVFRTHCD